MRCPGGVYPNWAAQSPATIIEQGPCQGDVIGPHNWDDFAAGFNLSPQRVVISAATNTVGELRSDRVQAYFIGDDRYFNGYEPLVCADDATAIEMVNRANHSLWRNKIELFTKSRVFCAGDDI